MAGLVGLLLLIDIPEIVRNKALLRAGGAEWLRDVDEIAHGAAREWDLTLGKQLPSGTESVVLEAGPDAVLKLELPDDPSFAARARLLEEADGRGYVRVLAYDVERRALLLERLGGSLLRSGLSVEAQLEVLVATLTDAWTVEPSVALATAVDKAQSLTAFISKLWHELSPACGEGVVERALEFASRRAAAFEPADAVLLQGDAHAANALRGPDGYRFVDPEFFVGEKAYDLGVSMREWEEPAAAIHARCERIGRLAGVAAEPIWEWGYIELVATGLYVLQVGSKESGLRMLATAERWLA